MSDTSEFTDPWFMTRDPATAIENARRILDLPNLERRLREVEAHAEEWRDLYEGRVEALAAEREAHEETKRLLTSEDRMALWPEIARERRQMRERIFTLEQRIHELEGEGASDAMERMRCSTCGRSNAHDVVLD